MCRRPTKTSGGVSLIDGDKAFVAAQVGGVHVVAGVDLERQFALPGNAARGFEVGNGEAAAGQRHRHFRRQAFKRGDRFGDRDLGTDHVFATGLRQPGTATVVEEDMPLVPETGRVLELDPADDPRNAPAKAALGADLDQCRIVDEFSHAAEVLQILALPQQRTAAEFTDSIERRRRAKADRRAAGGAGGGFTRGRLHKTSGVAVS